MSKSKLYDDILRALSNIFGMNDDATEAEVHAKLLSEETLISDLRAQISALEEGVRQLGEQVNELKAERQEIQQRCDLLQASLEEAKATASNLEAALEAQRAENVRLASEVVRLRSGQKGPEAVALDKDEHLQARTPASGGLVLDATDLFGRLLRKNSN